MGEINQNLKYRKTPQDKPPRIFTDEPQGSKLNRPKRQGEGAG